MTETRAGASPATVYAEGLAAGQLRYQRCEACSAAVFYPRLVCNLCGSEALTWTESAGRGTIYSTTTTRSREGDRNIALVELEEGFRMMCTVRDDGDSPPAIGEHVEVVAPVGTTVETLAFRRTGRS